MEGLPIEMIFAIACKCDTPREIRSFECAVIPSGIHVLWNSLQVWATFLRRDFPGVLPRDVVALTRAKQLKYIARIRGLYLERRSSIQCLIPPGEIYGGIQLGTISQSYTDFTADFIEY